MINDTNKKLIESKNVRKGSPNWNGIVQKGWSVGNVKSFSNIYQYHNLINNIIWYHFMVFTGTCHWNI